MGKARRSTPIAPPRDFLDEVESELREARCRLTENGDRLAALEELREVAVSVATALERPITVFDVVRSATEEAERGRRLELVRWLRTPSPP